MPPQLRADEVISGAPISAGRSVGERGSGIFQNVADPVEIGKSAVSASLYVVLVAGLWIAYLTLTASLVSAVYRQRARAIPRSSGARKHRLKHPRNWRSRAAALKST